MLFKIGGREGGVWNANWGLSGGRDVWGGGEYALAECLCGRGNLTPGFLPSRRREFEIRDGGERRRLGSRDDGKNVV